MSLETLPNEIIFDILMNLDYDDIIKFCQTDSQFKDLCNSDAFWFEKARHDFGVGRDEYYRDTGLNPRDLYLKLEAIYTPTGRCTDYESVDVCLKRALSTGDISKIKLFFFDVSKDKRNEYLLQTNNLDLIQQSIQNGLITYDELFELINNNNELFRSLDPDVSIAILHDTLVGLDINVEQRIAQSERQIQTLRQDYLDKYGIDIDDDSDTDTDTSDIDDDSDISERFRPWRTRIDNDTDNDISDSDDD